MPMTHHWSKCVIPIMKYFGLKFVQIFSCTPLHNAEEKGDVNPTSDVRALVQSACRAVGRLILRPTTQNVNHTCGNLLFGVLFL